MKGPRDGLLIRVYEKALKNNLAIAIGNGFDKCEGSINSIAEAIKSRFSIGLHFKTPQQVLENWNAIVADAEKATDRATLLSFINDQPRRAQLVSELNAIASIPVSNFIDATLSDAFISSLTARKRFPTLHAWDYQQAPSKNNVSACGFRLAS
jgi:hypothetical protein